MDQHGWIAVKSRQKHIKKDDIGTFKHFIHHLGIQELIRTRLQRGIHQDQADYMCGFPIHTFKNIECNRYIPNESQMARIKEIFGVELKIQC